jgi:hypothetical protein
VEPIRLSPGRPRRATGWWWLAAAYTVALLAAIGIGVWRSPYAISETIAVLDDLESLSWRTFFHFEGPYFRPAFWLTLDAVWRLAPSPEAALTAYKILHVASIVALVLLFAATVRVRTGLDWAAYAVALPILVGTGGFRDNLENLPLNQTLMVMVLALVAIRLLERPWRWWHEPSAWALAIAAPLLKEQGLAVAAVLAAGALAGAPGLTRRSGGAIATAAIAYGLWRAEQAAGGPPFLQEIGLGFQSLTAVEATARFGDQPLPIYAYNVAASAAHVLFGEPSRGVFAITQAIWSGTAAPSQWIQLCAVTSVTAIVAWWATAVRRHAMSRDHWLAWAFLSALAVTSVLGFNYTRDRFDGVAVTLYALIAYVAIRAALARVVVWPPLRLCAAAVVFGMLVLAWQTRAAGTVYYVRETAWQNRKEWILAYAERHDGRREDATYQRLMATLRGQGRDPSVPNQPLPRWVNAVVGYQW